MFSFEHVPNTQERWLSSSCVQSSATEQVYPCQQVQTDKSTKSMHVLTTERLASKNRLGQRIFPSTSGAESSEIPKIDISRGTPPNDVSTIWPGHGAKNICCNDKLGRTGTQKQRHSYPNISGRLFNGSSQSRNFTDANKLCSRPIKIIRVASKPQKIDHNPTIENTVSGYNLGYFPKHETPAVRKTLPHQGEVSPNTSKEKLISKRSAKPDRDFKLFKNSCTVRSITFSKPVEVHEPSDKRRPAQTISTPARGYFRTNMVDELLHDEFSNSLSTSEPLPFDRCLRFRLGSSSRQYTTERCLEPTGKEFSLESERDDCNSSCAGELQSFSERVNSLGPVGQCNRPLISQKRRGHQIRIPHESNIPNLLPTTIVPHTPEPSPPTGQVQCRSGSPLPRQPSAGVAPSPCFDSKDLSQMGDTRGGPVCIPSSACGPIICNFRHDGQRCNNNRCFFPKVGFQTGVGISAALSASQSPQPSESVQRDILNCSPTMGKSVLASRLEKTCNSPSVHNTEPSGSVNRHSDLSTAPESTRADIGDMEMWGWDEVLTDWTPEQRYLLQQSWRESTKKSYKSAWGRWYTWAKEHQIQINSPSGSDLARFLSDLYQKNGFAYNTILFHRSVVSTLSNPNNQQLGSHPLVKRILKSIAMHKPKDTKPPIWDIEELSTWISNNSSRNLSFYECSRRTACILLLCSGRRVHDLTLLSIDPANFTNAEDHIIFWPVYGSKTDCHDHRQSGWRLQSNPENDALNPVFLVKALVKLSKNRRDSCKIPNLFLTVCGTPKAASRTVIASWVKHMLQDAGIQATAGSTRPAVASKNWALNFPLDDILSRGNWRSSNTFSRFYKREIKQNTVIPTISTLFQSL